MSGGSPSAKRMLHFFWFGYQRRHGDEALYQEANVEIQKWAERQLAERFTVHSSSCITQGRVTSSARDILIGHPSWDVNVAAAPRIGTSARDWMTDNKLDPGAACHPNSYVLVPWVPEFPPEWTQYMTCYESQLERAKLVFAICGGIWLERTLALRNGSIQQRVRDKLVRLNMSVNADAFKIVKRAFNPVGRRRLVHVSNLGSYKGIDLLLESTLGVALPSLGSRSLKGLALGEIEIKVNGKFYAINNLGPINNDHDEQIRQVVDQHDFYIHAASMDAQATVILEFISRGLIPIVTPESGFEGEDAIYLTSSAERNREIIAQALQMPDEECVRRSARLKAYVRREHSWRAFYETIASRIEATCEN